MSTSILARIQSFFQHNIVRRGGPLLALLLLCAVMIYDYGYVNRYSEFPWWHRFGNDCDAVYASQTVAALNGGPLEFVYHPGAGIYGLHSLVYRAAAHIHGEYDELLRLGQLSDVGKGFVLLNRATRLSRSTNAGVFIVFMIAIFILFRCFGLNGWWAVVLMGYAVSQDRVYQHIHTLRPELYSLVFLVMGVAVYLAWLRPAPQKAWPRVFGYMIVGWLFGLAFLSKIQILPHILVALFVMCLLSWADKEQRDPHDTFTWPLRYPLSALIMTCVLFPWSALNKPQFLKEAYQTILWKKVDIMRFYGTAPDTFFVPVVKALLVLSAFWGISVVLKKFWGRPWGLAVYRMMSAGQVMLLGAVVSLYCVFLPVSVGRDDLFRNLNHTLYALCSNFFYKSMLKNQAFGWSNVEHILAAHVDTLPMMPFSQLWWVPVVGVTAGVRLFQRKTQARHVYAIMLLLLLSAVAVDFVSSLRQPERVYSYYIIYSWFLIVAALALLIKKEVREGGCLVCRVRGFPVAGMMLFILLAGQTVRATAQRWDNPRTEQNPKQNPQVDLYSVQYWSPYFTMVKDAVADNQGTIKGDE